MDSKTISEAFGIEAGDDEELPDEEGDEADEETLGSDIELAFSAEADPVERREAFIRAVKAAAKS